MTLGFRYIAIAISAGLTLIGGAMASAQPQRGAEYRPSAHQQFGQHQQTSLHHQYAQHQQVAAVNISPSQAKSIALRHVPGSEFLDIKLVGGNTYIVRVIKAGRRIDVYIDATSGHIKG